MTRSAVFVACVGVFCLGITPTASAEPITITTGFVHVDNIQSVGETLVETTMLLGTDGFRFNSGSAVNGFHCDCEPGAHMRFTGTFEDAGGTARVMFDGRGLNIRVSDDTAFVRIDTGTVMLPPITPGHTVLTVPFELEGVVRPEDLSMFPNGLEIPFSGQGTAHFEFVPEGPFLGARSTGTSCERTTTSRRPRNRPR